MKENKNHNIKTCIFNIGRLTSVLTVTQNHNSLHNPTRLPFTIYLNWTTYLNLLFYLLIAFSVFHILIHYYTKPKSSMLILTSLFNTELIHCFYLVINHIVLSEVCLCIPLCTPSLGVGEDSPLPRQPWHTHENRLTHTLSYFILLIYFKWHLSLWIT